MTITPVAMITPTKESIYAPSRLSPPRQISQKEFVDRYADHPIQLLVSFDPDGRSNPQPVTAYGIGLDVWYIVS